ncbi:HNH endonuclease [Sphingorhabdus sp.]|uniref:HNH endonuclease n=1 Tax=Sphingorhabdus sp. TaxID=1902408 RepID=UPI0037C5E850
MRRSFSWRQRKFLQIISDNMCQECGVQLNESFHADHVQPWSKDGKTILVNGQALCPPCNLRKGAS